MCFLDTFLSGTGFSACDVIRGLAGFGVSAAGGALVLWLVIDRLAWPYIINDLEKEKRGKPRRSLTVPLGIVERISYTSAIVLGAPTWIGVWLAIKVAAQWYRWQNEDRVTYNVFLLGNLISVLFGVLGAGIVLGKIPVLSE